MNGWTIASTVGRKFIGRTRAPSPEHLSDRFRHAPDAGLVAIRESLERNYFTAPRAPSGYLDTDWGRRDLEDHLSRRLKRDRERIIPWLDDVRPLAGRKVLEIGCGTGCSTVALAEQGATVVAVDVDEKSVEVARLRCAVYDLDATFLIANAVDVGGLLRGQTFDLIIFYASLEHMTHPERIAAIRATWEMLAPGDLWSVVETPNRLWHTDDHTSLLPFFHWLPDELAFSYASFSRRPNFAALYDDFNDVRQRQHFLRRGRGASFHEFAIAIGPPEQLNVRSCLSAHLAARAGGWRSWWPSWTRRRGPLDVRYRALLAEVYPSIHPAFFEKDLDLILMK